MGGELVPYVEEIVTEEDLDPGLADAFSYLRWY